MYVFTILQVDADALSLRVSCERVSAVLTVEQQGTPGRAPEEAADTGAAPAPQQGQTACRDPRQRPQAQGGLAACPLLPELEPCYQVSLQGRESRHPYLVLSNVVVAEG